MSAGQKVLGFLVLGALAFAGALGVGRLVGPLDTEVEGHGHDDVLVLSPADDAHHSHGEHTGHAGHTLDLARTVYDGGRQQLRFTIRDGAGAPVTAFEEKHERLLHLVVVRRDLGGYRHVHPRLDPETGEWSTPLDLDPGPWRVYADFTPRGGAAGLAEADVFVGGRFAPTVQGPDRATVTVDGYDVHLAREQGVLRLHVRRDGADVTDLEPYLGAHGHLVAIRAADLAYLHVHPADGPPGPEVAFHADLDEPGRYRLFFEFRHGGRVHRAQLDLTVGPHDAHQQQGTEDSGGHDH